MKRKYIIRDYRMPRAIRDIDNYLIRDGKDTLASILSIPLKLVWGVGALLIDISDTRNNKGVVSKLDKKQYMQFRREMGWK